LENKKEMKWTHPGAHVFQAYLANSKKIRNSLNNPLKRIENLAVKDRLEQQFYDDEAEKYLDHFDENLFRYDEHEQMPSSHRFFYSLLQDVENKKILDICCGYGFTSVRLAKKGGLVTGIDISPKMIRLTERNAEFNHVQDRITATIMSAQNIEFGDDSFDAVVGIGALHHLNLEKAAGEIGRVLKKGGTAIFIEPRIPFKGLIFVRSLLPNPCFESPGGSQLSDRDIESMSALFAETKIEYFLFLRKLTRFPLFNKIPDQLDRCDLVLVQRFPMMKKLYWAFVLQFTK
jgi:ubiquinone/menaquinone biosynthesis C-methylase UbiE